MPHLSNRRAASFQSTRRNLLILDSAYILPQSLRLTASCGSSAVGSSAIFFVRTIRNLTSHRILRRPFGPPDWNFAASCQVPYRNLLVPESSQVFPAARSPVRHVLRAGRRISPCAISNLRFCTRLRRIMRCLASVSFFTLQPVDLRGESFATPTLYIVWGLVGFVYDLRYAAHRAVCQCWARFLPAVVPMTFAPGRGPRSVFCALPCVRPSLRCLGPRPGWARFLPPRVLLAAVLSHGAGPVFCPLPC